MTKITHILFDCDNTLVLSEAIAFKGCAQISNEILESRGIQKSYTPAELQSEFVGFNFRGLLKALGGKYGFSLDDDELDRYVAKELQLATINLSKEAVECPHSTEILQRLSNEGKYKMAVVSSSALSRVQASLRKTKQDRFFQPQHIYSAASSLKVPTSKPDPAIYLYACEHLGVEPGACLAVEDSKSGATAAHRAGIPLVGYVGPYEDNEEEREEISRILVEECGARAIMRDWSEFPEILRGLQD